MSLVEHAKRELELKGEDPVFAQSIICAVAAFAAFGHSGGSAFPAIMYLHELLQFRPLTPITDNPEDWIDQSGPSGYPLWQNRRDSRYVSVDGGKTAYSVDDPGRTVYEMPHYEPTPVYDMGRHAYEAYFEYSDGKSLVSGAPLPDYEEQADAIKAAWAEVEMRLKKKYERT